MITTTPASLAARALQQMLSRPRTRDRSRPVDLPRDSASNSTGATPTTPSAKWLALG